MTSGERGATPGDGAPSTLATERTFLARVRTVVALVLVAAVVARATMAVRPAAALVCVGIAALAVVVLRLRPPLSHLALVGCVLTLAVIGLAGL